MIVHEDLEGIALLRLEHGKVNAIDVELLQALSGEVAEMRSSPPGALVLTGTGGNFSAGLDLPRFLAGGPEYAQAILGALHGALLDLFSLPFPVVAAVNGHAIAGGFVLACACDARIVSEGRSKFGITELPVGVPFPAAPLEMVRTVVGTRAARDLAYSGRLIDAEESLRLGFANELAPAEMTVARAVEIARTWSAPPARAFAVTKRQLQAPCLERLGRSAEIDAEVAEAWTDPETHAAMRAFIERTLGK